MATFSKLGRLAKLDLAQKYSQPNPWLAQQAPLWMGPQGPAPIPPTQQWQPDTLKNMFPQYGLENDPTFLRNVVRRVTGGRGE